MRIAYFDCFSGAAGDMILGALVDAGMPLSHLKGQLRRLPIRDYEVKLARARHDDHGHGHHRHAEIRGTNLRVEVRRDAKLGHAHDIDRMIAGSRLPTTVKEIARAVFSKLAHAEAAVHGVDVRDVHFHEVGATDAIVDIVGAAIGIEYFAFDDIHASPLPMTRGRVRCAHGTLPVPAPATLELLRGIPLEPSPVKAELVTPTGAAVLATCATRFGECPLQRIERVGMGFGDRVFPGRVNALRLMIGEGFPAVVIESNIDDMNPELFEHAMERCFAAGAVDCCLEPIQMKKNRPGVKLVAVAPWEAKDAVIAAILAETTSFGVRYWPVERRVLARELVKKRTKIGAVTFKLGLDARGAVIKAAPEYADLKKLARTTKRPLVGCYQEALAVARQLVRR